MAAFLPLAVKLFIDLTKNKEENKESIIDIIIIITIISIFNIHISIITFLIYTLLFLFRLFAGYKIDIINYRYILIIFFGWLLLNHLPNQNTDSRHL